MFALIGTAWQDAIRRHGFFVGSAVALVGTIAALLDTVTGTGC